MNIQKIRKEQGLTVQQLADKSGMPKRTLENIIRRDDCTVALAIKLADTLGVTLDELCRTQKEE
jgi:transcriptional regulator with XRE-family HTH domain